MSLATKPTLQISERNFWQPLLGCGAHAAQPEMLSCVTPCNTQSTGRTADAHVEAAPHAKVLPRDVAALGAAPMAAWAAEVSQLLRDAVSVQQQLETLQSVIMSQLETVLRKQLLLMTGLRTAR